jgi:hypothetical protein
MVSAKAMASALPAQRPAPVSTAREDRKEQPINAIPEMERQPKKCQNDIALGADLPPVLRKRQSVMALGYGRLAGLVVPGTQVGKPDLAALLISRAPPEAC